MLDSPRDVIRCLITYPDWWQPASSSVMKVGAARLDKNIGDGLNPGLIETIDERAELSRRMASIPERDRQILFLWYVKQMHVDDVAEAVKVSRRHCFRLRAAAVRRLVELGDRSQAA